MHGCGELEIATGTLTPIRTDLGDGRAATGGQDLQALKAAIERLCEQPLTKLDHGRSVDEPPFGQLGQQ